MEDLEKLRYSKKNVWQEVEREEIFSFAKGYMDFLNQVKTEREFVAYLQAIVLDRGFKNLAEVDEVRAGEVFYFNNRNKSFFIGRAKSSLSSGFKVIAAHIDSPRLDIKSQPLYEGEGLALFKTHYYGGIKKYQWVTMPLSLIGVVFRKDGSRLDLRIGEKAGDPVFTISDLLPHLAAEQMAKTAGKVVEGEKLNLIVGSIPGAKVKDEVKAGAVNEGKESKESTIKDEILKYLNREYGLLEEDFLRAELEVVPNFKAVDIGFDRGLIGAYGQDDRICAYCALEAFLAADAGADNLLMAFFDKEEIGSNGDTGAQSRVLEYLLDLLAEKRGEQVSPLRVLYNSKGISADVNGVDDPSFDGIFDKLNRGQLGFGPVVSKYTGSRGKYDSSDASAEYLASLLEVFDQDRIVYQFGELGKVDLGGGGTIASYLAQLGMEIVDVGTGLLSMHSPFELASKGDLYMTYRLYVSFLKG